MCYLAGGYGSRLGEITNKIPKPLLKINKIPFFILPDFKTKKIWYKKYYNFSLE